MILASVHNPTVLVQKSPLSEGFSVTNVVSPCVDPVVLSEYFQTLLIGKLNRCGKPTKAGTMCNNKGHSKCHVPYRIKVMTQD